MRGTGFRNIISENIATTKPMQTLKKITNKKPKLCWKCQEEKQTLGGYLKMIAGGPLKFICKDCLDKRKLT